MTEIKINDFDISTTPVVGDQRAEIANIQAIPKNNKIVIDLSDDTDTESDDDVGPTQKFKRTRTNVSAVNDGHTVGKNPLTTSATLVDLTNDSNNETRGVKGVGNIDFNENVQGTKGEGSFDFTGESHVDINVAKRAGSIDLTEEAQVDINAGNSPGTSYLTKEEDDTKFAKSVDSIDLTKQDDTKLAKSVDRIDLTKQDDIKFAKSVGIIDLTKQDDTKFAKSAESIQHTGVSQVDIEFAKGEGSIDFTKQFDTNKADLLRDLDRYKNIFKGAGKQADSLSISLIDDDIVMTLVNSTQPSPVSTACYRLATLSVDDTTVNVSVTDKRASVLARNRLSISSSSINVFSTFQARIGNTSPTFSKGAINVVQNCAGKNNIPNSRRYGTIFVPRCLAYGTHHNSDGGGDGFQRKSVLGRIEERMDDSHNTSTWTQDHAPNGNLSGPPFTRIIRCEEAMDVEYGDKISKNVLASELYGTPMDIEHTPSYLTATDPGLSKQQQTPPIRETSKHNVAKKKKQYDSAKTDTEAKRISVTRNSRYTGIKTKQSTGDQRTYHARQSYTQTVKKVQSITRNEVHAHPTVHTPNQVAAMFKPSTSLAFQSDSASQTSTMVKRNTSAAVQSATVGSEHAGLKCNPRRSSTKHIDGSRCNGTKQLDLSLLLSQIKWVGNTSSTSGLDVNPGKVPNSNMLGCTKVGVGYTRKRMAFDDLDQQPAAKYRGTNPLTVQTSKQVAAMFKPSPSLAFQSDSASQTSTLVNRNTSAAVQSATVGSGHTGLKCNPRRSSTKHIDGSRCNGTKQLDLSLLLSQIKWVGNTSSTSGLDVNPGKVPNSNMLGCTKVGVGYTRKRMAFDDLDQQPAAKYRGTNPLTVQTSKQVAAMFKPSTSLAFQSDSASQTSTLVKRNTSAAVQSATVGSGHTGLKCNPRRSSTKHIDGSRCNSTKQLDLALLLSQIKWVDNTSGGVGSTSGLALNPGKVHNSNLWGCTKVGVGHTRKRMAFDDLDQQPAAKYRGTNPI